MPTPEKCGHGMSFDEFCRECEILWAKEFIEYYERKLAAKKKRLAELKAMPGPD